MDKHPNFHNLNPRNLGDGHTPPRGVMVTPPGGGPPFPWEQVALRHRRHAKTFGTICGLLTFCLAVSVFKFPFLVPLFAVFSWTALQGHRHHRAEAAECRRLAQEEAASKFNQGERL